MSSAVAELDSILQSMLNLKPPGVTGGKITGLTALCTANVQVSLANLLLFILPELTTSLPAVRVRSHTEDLHTFQEDPRNTQVRSAVCRRLSNSTMGRPGQKEWPDS